MDVKGQISFCKVEKYKIITEPGKKVIKRKQIASQALIKRTNKHLKKAGK